MAEGRRLDEVFVIVNEDKSEPTPTTVNKALENGPTRGLADDKVLIARDGSEWPIDSSAAPIKDDRGETTGVVLVFRDVTDRKKADKERQGAEEATRRRAGQLQRLAEIASRINSANDVDSVVGVVTEEARSLIGARQSATSMVLTPHQSQPLNVISTASKRSYGQASSEIDRSELYEGVNTAKEAVRLTQDELGHDPRWQTLEKVALANPTNGWLAAPLFGRNGKSLGLLQLADKDEGEFTAEDEAILVQLSRLAAIAIENATLYDELRRNDQRKDEFLAMLAHELRNPLAAIGNAVSVDQPNRPEGTYRLVDRRHRPADEPPDPAHRRPARCLAHQSRQDRAPQGRARCDGDSRQRGSHGEAARRRA